MLATAKRMAVLVGVLVLLVGGLWGYFALQKAQRHPPSGATLVRRGRPDQSAGAGVIRRAQAVWGGDGRPAQVGPESA